MPTCAASSFSPGREPGSARSSRRSSFGRRPPAQLRPDVAYEDISVILWTTGRVVDATRDVEPQFWQRYLALVVDGLRAGSASPLPRPPLTPAKHRAAMQRFMQQRGRGQWQTEPRDA